MSKENIYQRTTAPLSKKINIALFCSSVNQLGGKNNHLKNIYKYLNQDKIKIFIICCSKVEKELKKFMLREGVTEDNLILVSRFKKLLFIPFLFEVRKVFLHKEIDIVHTFQMQSDIMGGLAARMAGIKSICSYYESKIIEDNISPVKQLFYKLCNRLIKYWFKITVVVSDGLKKELILGKFRPAMNIKVIYLGFETPNKYIKYQFIFEKLINGRPLIGTISRFSKEKGLGRFIAAIPWVLKELPEAKFILMGKGDEEDGLKRQIDKLGLNSEVTIITIQEWSDDVYNVLESIDIFVMPSLREGCPTALLQALALSRPVIASDIEGIKDIIEDGKDGILIDTADPVLFAEKIIFLCKNPDKAIHLGANGRQKILNDFTMESEMNKIRNLYLDICAIEN